MRILTMVDTCVMNVLNCAEKVMVEIQKTFEENLPCLT